LHEFVGAFLTNINPALVFAVTKQIPAMNKHWMKAQTLIIQDSKINYCSYLSSHLLFFSAFSWWILFWYYWPSCKILKVQFTWAIQGSTGNLIVICCSDILKSCCSLL
jgi:hypothetical protein